MGAVMMGLNWSITHIFLFLCLPSLIGMLALYSQRLKSLKRVVASPD